jgi:hypothetical protein
VNVVVAGPACIICGSRDRLEKNHVGGRNFIAWFTMWFCGPHHQQFHEYLRQSGIDLEYTPDPRVCILNALDALTVCQWILLRALREHFKGKEMSN